MNEDKLREILGNRVSSQETKVISDLQAYAEQYARERVEAERQHIMTILGNACELSMKLNGSDATIRLDTLQQLLADYVAPSGQIAASQAKANPIKIRRGDE